MSDVAGLVVALQDYKDKDGIVFVLTPESIQSVYARAFKTRLRKTGGCAIRFRKSRSSWRIAKCPRWIFDQRKRFGVLSYDPGRFGRPKRLLCFAGLPVSGRDRTDVLLFIKRSVAGVQSKRVVRADVRLSFDGANLEKRRHRASCRCVRRVRFETAD